MAKNNNLHAAKKAANDEFYTRIEDIENELRHYKDHFKNKIIFCNCDDPEESNFWKYFELNFEFLGLKKLISTHYNATEPSYKLELIGDIDGDGKVTKGDIIKTPLKQNGDFRSPECVEILKEADIVVTNPPFSIIRDYIAQLDEYNKKFIFIGPQNIITYKEVFPLIKDNKLWLGYTHPKEFVKPDGNFQKFGNISWFTNLEIKKRKEDLLLYKKYNAKDYPKYDNYDAINVDKVKDIPMDYYGVMGVPITFLDSYNPEQFEIEALGNSRENFTPNKTYLNPKKVLKNGNIINGNAINCVLAIEVENKPTDIHYTSDNSKYLIAPYARVLIKRK